MNKLLGLSLVLLGLFVINFTDLQAETTVEVRAEGFIPSKHRFRKVYGNASSAFGLEVSTDFWCDSRLWANFDQFNKNGHVQGCGDSKVHLCTFSFGLKRVYCLTEYLNGYLGIGLSLANIRIKNSQRDISTRSYKYSVGGVVKSGIYVALSQNIFTDIFADYYYQPVCYRYTTNCGGFRLGAGLGVAF